MTQQLAPRKPRYHRRITLATAVTALLLSLLSVAFSNGEMNQDSLLISRMHFNQTDATLPPVGLEEGTAEYSLPHEWRNGYRKSYAGWYSTTLTLEVPPNRLWGIFLPNVRMNAAVYLNGELLGHGGRFEEPMARNWTRPLYYTIPNGLLLPGENSIAIRIASTRPGKGMLGEVYLGPDETLNPFYESRFFVRVTLLQIVVASLLVCSLFLALMGLLRKRETFYLWFAAMTACWAAFVWNLIMVDIPLPTRIWDILRILAIGWFVVCMIFFIHRYLGVTRPRLERGVLTTALIGTGLLFLFPTPLFYRFGLPLWDVAAVVAGIYPGWFAFVNYRRTRSRELLMLLICGGIILLFGLLDLLTILDLRDKSWGYLLPYPAPLLMLIVSAMMTLRFVRAADQAEALNLTLEQRIAEKGQALEENYRRLASLQKEQVLAEERERIMRDMHDGIGGHLVTMLSLVEHTDTPRQRIVDLVREALSDLRLMIDSFEPSDDDLGSVLGIFRSRLAPILEQQQIELRWQVADVPPIPQLGPQKVLHLLRILQEATTNVLKHAGASRLTFSTGETALPDGASGVYLQVIDNGRGIASHQGGGHGLKNMRRRAEAIGAELSLEDAEPGTILRLTIPLV
ncbi:MAG: sensor histidine kinase [Candidatus Thiodiazotropha sp.]